MYYIGKLFSLDLLRKKMLLADTINMVFNSAIVDKKMNRFISL